MSFSQIFSHKKYDFTDGERYACPSYKFTCAKSQPFNGFRLYKVTKEGAVLLLSGDTAQEKESLFNYLNAKIFPNIKDHGVISAGHTVIHLDDKYKCGQSPVESTAVAMQIIEKLQLDFNKTFDYLIQYNDLYVDADLSRANENDVNSFRYKMSNPLIIPPAINQIILTAETKLNRRIPINYCFSKNLADKFKRYVKKKKKDSPHFTFEQNGGNSYWYYLLDGKKIPVLVNDKPNCIACNAAMLRDIRFTFDNKRVKDNYYSYLGIFPYCSASNVLNGCSIAHDIYPDLSLDTYIIILGDSCN